MATVVRWEPFRELTTLQNEMSSLMSSFVGGADGETGRSWMPALDGRRPARPPSRFLGSE